MSSNSPLLASLHDGRARILAVAAAVVCALASVLFAPGSAPAAGNAVLTGAAGSPASLSLPTTPLAARRGGGFRTRPRINPNRPGTRSRPVTRRRDTNRAFRSFTRTLLQALGIAFLLNMLFGIGAGGSPLGLLLLFGIIALFVVSRRRRRAAYYR